MARSQTKMTMEAVSENASVASGDTLLVLEGAEIDAEYERLLAVRDARTATLKKLLSLTKNPQITADQDGTVQDVNVSASQSTGTSAAGTSSDGTTGSYAQIQEMETGYGRFLMNADVENHMYVVVLTYDTAVELMGRADVTRETISLNGKSFQIIGVLSEKSSSSLTGNIGMVSSSSDEDSDSSVELEGYIPFSTMTRMSDNILDVTQFLVSATDESTLDPAEKTLTELLLKRFGNDEDAFSVTDQSQIMDTMESVNSTMSLMIGGIAAISLLVGGIGISWVILRAAGFFVENMQFEMDMRVVWISVIFSAVIGICFGLYPAWKAVAKKPIEALRYTG